MVPLLLRVCDVAIHLDAFSNKNCNEIFFIPSLSLHLLPPPCQHSMQHVCTTVSVSSLTSLMNLWPDWVEFVHEEQYFCWVLCLRTGMFRSSFCRSAPHHWVPGCLERSMEKTSSLGREVWVTFLFCFKISVLSWSFGLCFLLQGFVFSLLLVSCRIWGLCTHAIRQSARVFWLPLEIGARNSRRGIVSKPSS